MSLVVPVINCTLTSKMETDPAVMFFERQDGVVQEGDQNRPRTRRHRGKNRKGEKPQDTPLQQEESSKPRLRPDSQGNPRQGKRRIPKQGEKVHLQQDEPCRPQEEIRDGRGHGKGRKIGQEKRRDFKQEEKKAKSEGAGKHGNNRKGTQGRRPKHNAEPNVTQSQDVKDIDQLFPQSTQGSLLTPAAFVKSEHPHQASKPHTEKYNEGNSGSMKQQTRRSSQMKNSSRSDSRQNLLTNGKLSAEAKAFKPGILAITDQMSMQMQDIQIHSKLTNQPKQKQSNRKENQNEERERRKRRQKQTRDKLKLMNNLEDDGLNLMESLARSLNDNSYDCMICYDTVKRKHQCWSCKSCFQVFHLHCVKEWSQKSAENGQWRCPGCQTVNSTIPTTYSCFCGKEKKPRWDTGNPAHTCGDTCERSRACGHLCTAPCHAGPCSPCPILVERTCFCGKQKTKTRCSSKFTKTSCEKVCGKMLPCGNHTCQHKCHAGNCQPCDKEEDQLCYCGLKQIRAPCGSGVPDQSHTGVMKKTFSCGSVCEKDLDCNLHICEKLCHMGDCKPCLKVPSRVTHCPCGKFLIAQLGVKRRLCTDPIPTCGSLCGKLLPCGHKCRSKCHEESCPPCTQTMAVPCRCGSTSQQIPCSKALEESMETPTCKTICDTKKNCRRHRCSKECCPGKGNPNYENHFCTLPCGKTLRCGLHDCEELCHTGHCPPCLNATFEELTCSCGHEVMYPPIPCGTAPPACTRPCTRPQPCGHTASHPCHFGECPPCPQLISKPCNGGHGKEFVVQCHVKVVSCGMPCEKLLSCREHRCPAKCHIGPCDGQYKRRPPTDMKYFKAPVIETSAAWGSDSDDDGVADSWEDNIVDAKVDPAVNCGLECGKLRLCGHRCQATCHPGQACPALKCKSKVPARCKCGRRMEPVPCNFEGAKDFGPLRFEDLAAGNAYGSKHGDLSLSSVADTVAISEDAEKPRGPPQIMIRRHQLPCDKGCAELAKVRAQEERNKAIAAALDLKTNNTTPFLRDTFSDELILAARKDIRFIKQIEEALGKFINDDTKKQQYRFPVMNAENRKIVHNLAESYGLVSESEDPEPHRSVVIFRSDFQDPRIPSPLLSDVK
eukprot:m.111091 g.111091  ORF g.111091 m.111091 type:complete len:1111 (+) comp14054_c0_seq3:94-3426(+)